MLKISFTWVLLLVIFGKLNAQQLFQKRLTIGGNMSFGGSSVRALSNGEYVGISNGYSSLGTDFIHIYQLNSLGSMLNEKSFDITGGNMSNQMLSPTSDGGFILGQWGYIVKLDGQLNIQWSRQYDGGGVGEYGHIILPVSDGSYTSISSYFSGAKQEILFSKVQSNGSPQFSGILRDQNPGVSLEPRGAVLTDDGGILITGRFRDQFIGEEDILICRLDSLGNLLWGKRIGTSSSRDVGEAVCLSYNSSFLILGSTEINGKTEMLVLSIDSGGNLNWSKVYDSPGDTDYPQDIISTVSNGFTVLGVNVFGDIDSPTGSDLILFSCDSIGNVLWANNYGNSELESGGSLDITPDGGYVFDGYTITDTVNWYFKTFLVRTDAQGNSGCADQSPVSVSHTPLTLNISNYSLTDSAGIALKITPVTTSINTSQIIDCSSTAVSDYVTSTLQSEIRIYPNPAIQVFTVTTENSWHNANVVVLNSLGLEVFKISHFSGQALEVPRENLPAGMYLIQVLEQGKKIAQAKVVLE